MIHMSPHFWELRDTLEYRCHGGIIVQYAVRLINAPTCPNATLPRSMPLFVFFGGMNTSTDGGLSRVTTWLEQAPFYGLSTFVFVIPLRPQGHWWFLDNDSAFGWVDGKFCANLVDAFLEWIRYLSSDKCIDPEYVSLLGFSAGAYAVAELLARNSAVPIRGVVIGGVHGHGQPDTSDLEPSQTPPDDVLEKWTAFLARLRGVKQTPSCLIGIHNIYDCMCPWKHAELIYREMISCLSPHTTIDVRCPFGARNHNYFDQTFTSGMMQKLLPGNTTCSHIREQNKRSMKCHTPGCFFLVHPDYQFGGFCCRQCHMIFDSNLDHLRGWQHGPKCLMRLAVSPFDTADFCVPHKPMTLSSFNGQLVPAYP